VGGEGGFSPTPPTPSPLGYEAADSLGLLPLDTPVSQKLVYVSSLSRSRAFISDQLSTILPQSMR
jgi:hypothetical protein